MSTARQTVSSQKVINERLKNGQCIHCGIQTHKIIKKRFKKPEKEPLNIPASCQQAGSNVTVDDNGNKPNRLSGVSANAVGTAASVTGAVLTGLGVPVAGEVLTGVGEAVSQSSSQQCSSSAGAYGDYNNMMQALNNPYANLLSSPAGGMNNNNNDYMQILNQQQQQANQQMAQASANLGQQQQVADQQASNAFANLAQMQQQSDQQMQQVFADLAQQQQAADEQMKQAFANLAQYNQNNPSSPYNYFGNM